MKIVKNLIIAAFVAIAGMAMTSCSGYSNSSAKDMIIKEDQGKLTEEDYTQMIQWVEEAYNESLGVWEKEISNNPNYWDYYFANKEDNQEFDEEYLYIDDIRGILLKNFNDKTFGDTNRAQFEKINESYNKRVKALKKLIPEKK
ncbi:MAG: hypothetical protein NC402_07195 [Prevotella sp.]|nr:hypothetical protein [Prevotella sp.]MCM1074338.1 hypothetical protein [Ruminococcus sp.]